MHYIVDPYITMLHISKCRLRGDDVKCTTLSSSIAMDHTAQLIMTTMSNLNTNVDNIPIGNHVTMYQSFVDAWSLLALPTIELLLSSSKSAAAATDIFNQTILHRASEGGVLAVVQAALRALPSSLNLLDAAGETPLDRAWARYHVVVIRWLEKQGAKRGAAAAAAAATTATFLQPRLVAFKESSHDLLHYYQTLLSAWTIKRLSALPNFTVRPGSLPYPDVFGGEQSDNEVLFAEYASLLSSFSTIKKIDRSGYIFEKLTEASPLWTLLEEDNNSNSLLHPTFLNRTVTSTQWSFGAQAGTGSSWHYHTESVTLLLHGEKRWFFMSPPDSVMSNVVEREEWEEWEEWEDKWEVSDDDSDDDDTWSHQGRRMITFVQRPGDLVFVPDRWSHRTRNERMTMGLTFEVAPVSQRPMEPIHVDYVRPALEKSWRWCGVLMGKVGAENVESTMIGS